MAAHWRERALRAFVRDIYASRFGDAAAQKIEQAMPDGVRDGLARRLRARPVGSDPLSIVDYLYLAELPLLISTKDVWQEACQRLGGAGEIKQRLLSAVNQIAPVRNEIAHVREVGHDQLLRATVACGDLLEMLQGRT